MTEKDNITGDIDFEQLRKESYEDFHKPYAPNKKYQIIRAAFNKFAPQVWLRIPDEMIKWLGREIIEPEYEDNYEFKKDMSKLVNTYKENSTTTKDGKAILNKNATKNLQLAVIEFFKKHAKLLAYDSIEAIKPDDPYKELPEEIINKIENNSFYDITFYRDNDNIIENVPIQIKDITLSYMIKTYCYEDFDASLSSDKVGSNKLSDRVDTMDFVWDDYNIKWMFGESMDESLSSVIRYFGDMKKEEYSFIKDDILKDMINRRMDKTFLSIMLRYPEKTSKLITDKNIIIQMINFGLYKSLSHIAKTNKDISKEDLKLCKKNSPQKILFFKLNEEYL